MKGRLMLIVGTGFALSLAITAGFLSRPVDDLAFLKQWDPVEEQRVGDWGHPGDPSYGKWTVLRFPTPQGYGRFLDRSERMSKNHKRLDLESEIERRLPSGCFVRKMIYDVDYVDIIKEPGGGPDRFLWVANGWNTYLSEDRYQVWTKDESWFQSAWANMKRHLGL